MYCALNCKPTLAHVSLQVQFTTIELFVDFNQKHKKNFE